MSNQTLEIIKVIVTQKLGLKSQVIDATKPMSEFGIDSLTQVELLFAIEEHFSIQIPDSKVKIETLTQLCEVIDEVVATQAKTA